MITAFPLVMGEYNRFIFQSVEFFFSRIKHQLKIICFLFFEYNVFYLICKKNLTVEIQFYSILCTDFHVLYIIWQQISCTDLQNGICFSSAIFESERSRTRTTRIFLVRFMVEIFRLQTFNSISLTHAPYDSVFRVDFTIMFLIFNFRLQILSFLFWFYSLIFWFLQSCNYSTIG